LKYDFTRTENNPQVYRVASNAFIKVENVFAYNGSRNETWLIFLYKQLNCSRNNW